MLPAAAGRDEEALTPPFHPLTPFDAPSASPSEVRARRARLRSLTDSNRLTSVQTRMNSLEIGLDSIQLNFVLRLFMGADKPTRKRRKVDGAGIKGSGPGNNAAVKPAAKSIVNPKPKPPKAQSKKKTGKQVDEL